MNVGSFVPDDVLKRGEHREKLVCPIVEGYDEFKKLKAGSDCYAI